MNVKIDKKVLIAFAMKTYEFEQINPKHMMQDMIKILHYQTRTCNSFE